MYCRVVSKVGVRTPALRASHAGKEPTISNTLFLKYLVYFLHIALFPHAYMYVCTKVLYINVHAQCLRALKYLIRLGK